MTLLSDLRTALTDEALHNVALVGTDSLAANANKTILGMRSPVFKRMFWGNFSERDCPRVDMNYPSVVLRVIVTYCYTDELDLDALYKDDDNGDAALLKDEEAIAMIQLRDAANYLELKDLHKTITNELGDTLKGDLSTAVAVLNELYLRGQADGPFWEILMDLVLETPYLALFPKSNGSKGIAAASFGLLTILFRSKNDGEQAGTAENEADIDNVPRSFPPLIEAKALKAWSQFNKEWLEKDKEGQEAMEHLKGIAETVQLAEISASDLSHLAPCPLFSIERLYNALVHQIASPVHPKRKSNHLILKVAYVRGAGIHSVNGIYNCRHIDFRKEGEHMGMWGWFAIVCDENIWKIVFSPKGSAELHSLYEAPVGTTSADPASVPFSVWDCVHGESPAPYVAFWTRGNDSPQNPLSSSNSPSRKMTNKRRIIRAKRTF